MQGGVSFPRRVPAEASAWYQAASDTTSSRPRRDSETVTKKETVTPIFLKPGIPTEC